MRNCVVKMYSKGKLTLVTILVIFFGGVSSLRDVTLRVRPYPVIRGGSAAIICDRDMQGAALYSVKWYRGSHEFYRYTPSETPNNQVFGLPGVYVDMNSSNGTQVLLRRLDMSLAGNFSCEVTAESPNFSTQIAAKFIDIIAPPTAKTILISDKDHYVPGDILKVNCTSSPSRPAVNLTIFINEEALRSSESSLHPSESGLMWATARAELPLTPTLFPNSRLRVSCVATLYNVYRDDATLDFFTPEVDPRPERITLGGGSPKLKFQNWILLLLLLFLPSLVFGDVDLADYDPEPYENFEYYEEKVAKNVLFSLI